MDDLFQASPEVRALLARIEALEAAVFQKAKKVKKESNPEPLMEAWSQWESYRHGKGWTANARALNMRKLRELAGEDGGLALRIVQQSIEFGWQGLFPLKTEDKFGKPEPVRSPMPTAKEALTPKESKLDNAIHYAGQQFQLHQDRERYEADVAEARRKFG